MPEWNENSQHVAGNENTLIQDVRSSNINIINNYGMPTPPSPIDEFSTILKDRHPPMKIPLHEKIRVNCDRNEQLRKMRNHNSNSNQHLFYFILACPNELPEKLVQNFVFELINDNSYSDDNPVLFKISSDFNGTNSIDIQSLSELNINSIQRKWLEPLKNRDYIFENFISQELSKQKLEYLVSAFKISIKDFVKEELESLMDSWMKVFHEKADCGPKCISCFIIDIKDYPNRALSLEEQAISNYLIDLCNNNSNRLLLIDSLPKVTCNDLEVWLGQVLKGLNPIDFFDEWARKTYGTTIERQPNSTVDMRIIDVFQTRIWEIFNNK